MPVDLTKVLYYIPIRIQEECDMLLNATIDGDMEVVSTLISDGVDMNANISEVCITDACSIRICTDVAIRGVQHLLKSCMLCLKSILKSEAC